MKIKILDGYEYLENEIGGDTKEIEHLIKDRIIERIGRNAIFSYYEHDEDKIKSVLANDFSKFERYSFYDFLKRVYLQNGGVEEVVKIHGKYVNIIIDCDDILEALKSKFIEINEEDMELFCESENKDDYCKKLIVTLGLRVVKRDFEIISREL